VVVLNNDKKIHVGELKTQMMLQMKFESRGDDGSIRNVYTYIGNIWTKVAPIDLTSAHEEYFRNNKILAESTHEITIRYRANISTDMRLIYGNRIFEILGYYEIEGKRDYLKLNCKEARK